MFPKGSFVVKPAVPKASVAVKTYVKKAINRALDKDIVYYNSGVVNTFATTTTYSQIGQSLSEIPQGSATGTRRGDTVSLKGIWLSMRLRTTNTTVGDIVTVSILRYPASSGLSVVPNAYYANDTAQFAPISAPQNDTGLKKVWAKTFRLPPNGGGDGSTYFNRYIKFKSPIKISYLRGVSTGTDASVVDNCIAMFGSSFGTSSIDYTVQGYFESI